MSAINLMGAAKTPVPAIYVSFRSFSQPCENPLQCAVGLNDTSLKTGQGSHGSLSRAETRNFMAAIGPDFKSGFVDPAPVSNADLAITLAKLMDLDLHAKGALTGRVLEESLTGGAVPAFSPSTVRSAPAANGFVTILNLQTAGATPYFDAAGTPGRTVGLKP
jgi:hypothetical protein